MLVASGYITSKGELSWAGMAKMMLSEALELATTITIAGSSTAQVMVTRLDPDNPPPAPNLTTLITDAPEPDEAITALDEITPEPMAAGAISYSQLEKWRKCGLRRYLERDLGLQGPGVCASADTTGEQTLTSGDPDRDGRKFGHLVH